MKHLILLLSLFVSVPAWADGLNLPENMSAMVIQAKDGKILFEHRAHQAMTPASTTKILTAYIALKKLGPDFTFNTQILKNGDDLWVRFSGDPSLTQSDLKKLLTQALRSQHIQSIKGNIFIDTSAFQAPWVARGWTVDDTPWYYAAPVHSVILDENKWTLTITPPEKIGQAVKVTARAPELKIHSKVTAVDMATAETLCEISITMPQPNHVSLEGCWPQANPPQNLHIANRFPLETAKSVILHTLKTQNITFSGTIKMGKPPGQATLLAQHSSPPLTELLKPVLQDSNNLYTETLTKKLGEVAYQRPTFQAGSYYIERTLLKELPLTSSELDLSDGSGLSTLNLVSANVLGQTLLQVYQNQQVKPYFIPALAGSGTSGTLKHRMKDLATPFLGKTGGMTHVSTLAGYYGLETDNPLIYIVMANHSTQKGRKLKKYEDNLLTLLIKSYFTNNSEVDTL